MGQTQRCAGIKPVNGIPTLRSWYLHLQHMSILCAFVWLLFLLGQIVKDAKRVLRIRKSKKDRHYNGQKKIWLLHATPRDFRLLKFPVNEIEFCYHQSYLFNNFFFIENMYNMRQAQPVWRTKSYNFKREAWEGNVFFFKYFLKFFFIVIWLELCLFDLWLFRSFYLRRSSVESFVRKRFFY